MRKTKKTISIIMMGLMIFCVGCGNNKTGTKRSDKSDNATEYYTETEYYASDMDYEEYDGKFSVAPDYNQGFNDNYESVEGVETDNTGNGVGEDVSDKLVYESGMGNINQEMLVYRGVLKIDTLDFNTSVSEFKATVKNLGGIVESESYTDNYSSGGYYAVDENKKHNVYIATVRIPSSEYDNVMNNSTTLGDVRTRKSNATNVTKQYGTYKSQLEIYEAEYDRYLKLLENATDDSYALMIENELFDIQMNIAELKSSITNIENDVAYSYIDITISEVKEYVEEPAPSDTFGDRFKNKCKESWENFLEGLEDLVFFFVMNIYAIIIIVIIVIVAWRIIRKAIKKSGIEKPVQQIVNAVPDGTQTDNTVIDNTTDQDK